MQASKELFLDYRPLLFSTAYNMLGSVEDAEDMVQETYLKWIEMPETPITHVKAYLVRVLVNKCINYLETARVQREEYIGTWLPEAIPDTAFADEHHIAESYHALSIGMLIVLEKLTPQERAIFILREVFAYDYNELSEILGKSEDSCRQIFKRAKDQLGKKGKRFKVDTKAHEAILNNFIEASFGGNINELIALFKEDIALYADGGGKTFTLNGVKLSAVRKPIHGSEGVATFLTNIASKIFKAAPDVRIERVSVNGEPSFVSYFGGMPLSVITFETDGEKISKIFIQSNPDKLTLFSEQLQRN
ncbi:MAG TPA: sigma-70 family RNA polymerase sigma factor [Candidatus Kapabacteria bacterium]|nr:sigma-70 family RNA polymerase sigma factor [Candidatus Kapabacteria bacterium]